MKNKYLIIAGVAIIGIVGYLALKKKGVIATYPRPNPPAIKYSDGFTLSNGVLKDGYGTEIDTGVSSYDPVLKIITYTSGLTQDLKQFF